MPGDDERIENERIRRLEEEMHALTHPDDGNIDYLRIERLGRHLRDAHLRRGLSGFFARTRLWLSTWIDWHQAHR